MRRFTFLAVLLLAVPACGGPAPQPAVVPAPVEPGAIEAPPVHSLIGHRTALQLTSEQITVLDSIGQHVQSENQALMRRLGEMRTRTVPDQRTGRAVVISEEGRGLLERIRQNNREAVQGVRAVLTAEQQAETCRLFAETDRQRQRRAEMRRANATQPGAMGTTRRPAAGEAVGATTVWPWCAERTTPADTASAPRS